MKKYLIGFALGALLIFAFNIFGAITLQTPIVETNTSSKIKITNISWAQSGLDASGKALLSMSIIYKDQNGKLKTYSDFSRANCKNVMNRVENILLTKPEFAGVQADDPDEQ